MYKPTGESWRAELFKQWHQAETIAPASMVVDVTKSITDKIVCDSGIEKTFAQFLEKRDDVLLFIKSGTAHFNELRGTTSGAVIPRP